MNDREALKRIAEGKVNHKDYCGQEPCDHPEEFAHLYLAGKDPDEPQPRYDNGTRLIAVTEEEYWQE